jgi:hypothetical protein
MTDTSIIPHQPRDVGEALALSERLSSSNLLPEALRRKPGDVLVILLTGAELGLAPMAALRSIAVINGKPVMAADLMVGLAMRSSACKYLRLVKSTSTEAVYETLREGHPEPTRMTWTMAQAQAAGLAGKGSWRSYPDAMLRARCSAALCRAVYPDLLAGVYETGEGEEIASRETPAMRTVQQVVRAAPEAPAAEVVVEAQVVQPTPAGSPMIERIQAAERLDALQALVAEIRALPAEEQAKLRPDYNARKVALSMQEPAPEAA